MTISSTGVISAVILLAFVGACGQTDAPTGPAGNNNNNSQKVRPYINVAPYSGDRATGLNLKGGGLLNQNGDSTLAFTLSQPGLAWHEVNGSDTSTKITLGMSAGNAGLSGYIRFTGSKLGLRRSDSTNLASATITILGNGKSSNPDKVFGMREGWAEIEITEYGDVGGLVTGTFKLILTAPLSAPSPDIHISGRFSVERIV